MKLYNTLSKQAEEIAKKDHLNLYTCGPTVYNYAHIGNLRTYISSDLLYRALKYEGYNPKWVMNITDVDDKTIKGAIEKFGKDAGVEELKKFTEEYFQGFIKDLAEVNVLVNEITFIKVTDVIPQIQKFIVSLIDKGYAYKAEDGSTYFSIEKYQKDFGDYGVLVGEKFIEGKKVGARVAVDEYEKENLSDFALWKANTAEDGNIFWDHPTLGKGRPGWHIECSVINEVAFKSEPTDIHTGAVDLVFPHHTNEIAQSQALLGKGNFVKLWSHAEHLLVDGKKMAKSANNFYRLTDLQAKVPLAGLALRYLFSQSGYRAQQNFTFESFLASYKALEKLHNTIKAHKVIGENQELNKNIFEQFQAQANTSLGEDLNVPRLLAFLWDALNSRDANINTQDAIALNFNNVLGLKLDSLPNIMEDIEIPENVKTLIKLRETARLQKDFKKSDELRKEIEDLGYEVKDLPEGQKCQRR